MPRGPFSSRVPESLEPGPWARRLAQMRGLGRPLIDLTDHNPTTADLGYLEGLSLLLALSNSGGRVYAPSAAGLESARQAVAIYYQDRGHLVDPSQVVLTSSTSEAYAHLFRLLCDPGEAILVPRPGYPLFDALARAEGCRVVTYPLRFRDGAWRLDIDSLIAILRETPDARAIVTVNPNHPTGSCLTIAEATSLWAACELHDLAFISDEVFDDYRAADGRDPAGLVQSFTGDSLSPFAIRTPLRFVLSGLSKVCGLPQAKLGWIVVVGPPTIGGSELGDAALERLEWLADTFLSVGGPIQSALPALLAGRARFQDEVKARVARNRAALVAALAPMPNAQVLPADGGWSAVIALDPVKSDEEWALALLEHDVIVHPGYFYDFDEPGRIVVSLLPAPAGFDVALTRLTAVAAR